MKKDEKNQKNAKKPYKMNFPGKTSEEKNSQIFEIKPHAKFQTNPTGEFRDRLKYFAILKVGIDRMCSALGTLPGLAIFSDGHPP